MARFSAHVLAGLICFAAAPALALSPWRVCLPDAAFPPFLNNDPKRLGLSERLMVVAGQRVGVDVSFERLPYQRCAALVREGQLDALVAPAAVAATPGLQFPRRASGDLDSQRLLARAPLVWLQRPGGALQWDGRQLTGLAAGAMVGMRSGMVAGTARLRELGLRIDQSPRDATQLLSMLQQKRFDAVVLLEAEFEGVAHGFQGLEVLPRPLQVEQYYLAASAALDAARQAQLLDWWQQIGLMRDSIAFRK